MNGLLEFLKTIGGARLAAMGAVAVGLVGFFIFIMMRLSEPQMDVLYTDMTLDDSGAIVRELEAANIVYTIRNEGQTILVPSDKVLRLRLNLAEQGLPEGGMVGYEIFDKGETLGATSFVQNINHLRALEGELGRTIRAIDKVQLARVHLVLPTRVLFSREQAEPSASIVLRVRGDLAAGQTRAIQHLVASAVKDLQPHRVSIVDETGRLLASGNNDSTSSAMFGSLEERNAAFESRLERQISEIVTSIVGSGNARIQVTTELDYNRITQTSDTYDPESQVVRSTQTREETSAAQETADNDAVSVGNELPGANENQNQDEAQTSENASKTEETVNYEISHTTKTEILEAGRIKRISVAVLVNGLFTQGTDGKPVYAPRQQEQLDQIASLVRSAIGFDRTRGDQVEIVNLQFAPEAAADTLADAEAGFLNLTKEDYFYIAELFTLLVVSLLVLLFVVRPLIRRIVTPDGDTAAISGGPGQVATLAVDAAGNPIPRLTGPEGENIAVAEDGTPFLPIGESATATMIDATQAIGSMHETSLKKVGELVQNNPDEAIAIVRHWLSEGTA